MHHISFTNVVSFYFFFNVIKCLFYKGSAVKCAVKNYLAQISITKADWLLQRTQFGIKFSVNAHCIMNEIEGGSRRQERSTIHVQLFFKKKFHFIFHSYYYVKIDNHC